MAYFNPLPSSCKDPTRFRKEPDTSDLSKGFDEHHLPLTQKLWKLQSSSDPENRQGFIMPVTTKEYAAILFDMDGMSQFIS